MSNNKKVFEGKSAMIDFLTPGSLGMTPLVELPISINKFLSIKLINKSGKVISGQKSTAVSACLTH